MTKKKHAPPAHNCRPPAHSCQPPAHSCQPPVNNCSSLTCEQIEADAEISFAFFRNEGFPQIDSDDFDDEYLLQNMSDSFDDNIENNGTMQKEAMPNKPIVDPNIYEACLKAVRKSKRKKKQKTNQEEPLNVVKEPEIQVYNTEHVLEETNQWLAQIRSQNQHANVDNTPEENNKSKTAKGSGIKTNNGREDKKASMKEIVDQNVAGNESPTGRTDKKHVENDINQKMKEETTRQQNNNLNQMTDFQTMMAYTREGFPDYWQNVQQQSQPPVYTLFGPRSNHHEVERTRGPGSLLKDLEALMEPALTAQQYAPKIKPFQIQTNWRREQLLSFDDGQTGNRPCGCDKRKQPGGGQPGNSYPFPRCCEQFQARACFNSTSFCPPTKDIPPSTVAPGQHNCSSPMLEYFATVPGQNGGCCPCGCATVPGQDVGCCPCGCATVPGQTVDCCPCGCSESILCTQTPCPYHDRMACEILAKYGITDLKLDDTPYEPYDE